MLRYLTRAELMHILPVSVIGIQKMQTAEVKENFEAGYKQDV
jgi:hypothetical protein